MTSEELKQRAIALSGRPARKNKHGHGALHWLAIQPDAHPSTVVRWLRGASKIPQWAINRIVELERESAKTEV